MEKYFVKSVGTLSIGRTNVRKIKNGVMVVNI